MKPSVSLAVAVIVTADPVLTKELLDGEEIVTVGAVPTAVPTVKLKVAESKVVVPSLAVARARMVWAPTVAATV